MSFCRNVHYNTGPYDTDNRRASGCRGASGSRCTVLQSSRVICTQDATEKRDHISPPHSAPGSAERVSKTGQPASPPPRSGKYPRRWRTYALGRPIELQRPEGRAEGGRKVRHKRSVQDSRLREPNFGYHVSTLGRSTSRPFVRSCATHLSPQGVRFTQHARGAFQDFSPSTCTHQYHHCIIRTHHSCAPSCYILPHTEHNLPSPRSFRSRVPINTQLINPFRNIS